MRTVIGIFLLILVAHAPLKVYGQEDYTPQLEVMAKVNSLVQDKRVNEALSFLHSNNQLFQIDEITKFWFDWLNGVILYREDRFSEARPYISESISFLDKNISQLADASMIRFLQVYYYAPDIDYRLGAPHSDIINELEHAKFVYESAHATSEQVYTWIISDLNSIKENIVNLAAVALNNFIARDYQQAIPQLLNVIEYAKTNKPDEYIQLVNWMKALAMAYGNIGDYNNAERYYLESLDVLETHGLQKDKIYRLVLDGISVLYVSVQNFDKANHYNGKAKLLFEEAFDFGDDYVRCLSNAALIQNSLGYNSVAKMQLDVALRQAKKNLSDTTSFSSSLMIADNLMVKPIDAQSFDRNYYIQVRIVPYITLLSNASVVYSNLGYFPEAVRAVKESIRVAEEYGLKEALPYNNLGTLYLYKSKFPQAAKWFMRAYPLCKTPYESDDIGMNTVLGLFLSHDDRTASIASEVSSNMRQNIKSAFAFLNASERTAYWKHYDNYLPMINLAIYESGKPEYFGTIYDNILESKGLLLRSTNNIRDAVLNSNNTGDKETYNRLVQMKQQLQTETDSVKRVEFEKEIDRLDKMLTRNVSAYADFAKRNNVCWTDVKNALSDKDIAIEFYNIPLVWGLDSVQTMDGEPRYCAVALKKDYEYPHIIPLCKETQIEELENYDFYETDSIYNLIWKPLEEELKGVESIYFAADRDLHKIGIEYALMPDNKRIDDNYSLYRLSSTRELVAGAKSTVPQYAVLYGGLKYDVDKDDLVAESRGGQYHSTSVSRATDMTNLRYGVHYLPGTLDEVKSIASDFNGSCQLVTDLAGTEESFKALSGKSVNLIHLATHGFFWSEEDAEDRNYVNFLKKPNDVKQSFEDKALLRSGLFFSGANIGLRGEELPDDVEDGVLTAQELSNINLGNIDMVVMSACQSGLGETTGEGVFGLQRGFKLAGANTLLMSLWKVDDAATKLLMANFYKHYLSGKTKQESLKLAQQSLRNDPEYSDYEYWAAFILLDGLN